MRATALASLMALLALAGQAKTLKTIKKPVAMSHNIYKGELKAREVIMRDTATTVHLTMVYKKGDNFRFAKDSYLLDEEGNRYALRSAEGLKLDSWVKSPESGTTDFTMHFEPMPKRVRVFDFIEGDGNGAFVLLGIHDKKTKLKAPTAKELSKANPWTVPADWLKTDTITIRGRFEGYNAERFGFTSMQCYYEDVFEEESTTLVFDIADDGTFEKKFQASYPIQESFTTYDSKIGFDEIPFFARPGETIDITIRKNERGQYECYYNNGSSKDVARWLKTRKQVNETANALRQAYKDVQFSQINGLTETTWQNMMYRLAVTSRREHFTPMEMQLALADAQVNYAYAMMDYAMRYEDEQQKYEQRDGRYYKEILDSVELEECYKMENYTALHRVDFDNPLILASSDFAITLNRIQYARPVSKVKYGGSHVIEHDVESERMRIERGGQAWRELMGNDHTNQMAQVCLYKEFLHSFKVARHNEALLDSIKSLYNEYYTIPYISQKAEAFCAQKLAQKEMATPLPENNPAADLIRSICAKYPGRYLMIDFWDMGCGPCRAAIEQSKDIRAKIAKQDDVKLVFIAGEKTAEGSKAYHEYVQKWLADEETVCIKHTDFTRLQELFRFNGIPHYETITPDCRRVRDDHKLHHFSEVEYNLPWLIKRLK